MLAPDNRVVVQSDLQDERRTNEIITTEIDPFDHGSDNHCLAYQHKFGECWRQNGASGIIFILDGLPIIGVWVLNL